MATFRVNYLFSQKAQRIAGWSENFYLVQGTLSGAIARAADLASDLELLHGRQAVLDVYRVTNVADRRLSSLIEYRSNQQANPTVSATTQSDYPTTAALIEVTAENGVKTRQWIKGIYDDIVVNGGLFVDSRDWQRLFNAFATRLADDANAWVQRQAANTTQYPITAFDPATGIFTITGNTFTVGERIKITGFRGTDARYLNKTWRVKGVAGNSVTLLNWDPPKNIDRTEFANPLARVLQYNYIDITGVDFKRISKRDVGRPFAVLSGRRRR